MPGRILAMGSGGFMLEQDSPLDDFLLRCRPPVGPRVCYLPSPRATPIAGSRPSSRRSPAVSASRAAYASSARRSALRSSSPSQDVIYVSGGNTANALALWRLHGVDAALREAWERGTVLGGGSAGANCWLECCVTDSFGRQLDPLRDGLGILCGSFCPHYDGEELRRPTYRRLVDDGFPPGFAADDHAALHFEGSELCEAVASRPGSLAYRVDPGSETPLETRVL